MNYIKLAKEIHENAVKKGFWDDPDIPTKQMLIISEIGEAVEALRDGKRIDKNLVELHFLEMYDGSFPTVFENEIKDTFEDELADIFIRILDLAEYLGNGKEFISIVELMANTTINGDGFSDILTQCGVMMGLLLITSLVIDIGNIFIEEERTAGVAAIGSALGTIELFAKHENIDLEFHVTQKMKYNKTRPFKHGKEF